LPARPAVVIKGETYRGFFRDATRQSSGGAAESLQAEREFSCHRINSENMKSATPKHRPARLAPTLLSLLLLLQLAGTRAAAQQPAPVAAPAVSHADRVSSPGFRLERLPIEGGAELLTIFGSLNGLPRSAQTEDSEVPLVSVVRDTLADPDHENDRLRYVWMHTYTRPTGAQRAASAVPFLYTRVGSRGHAGGGAPPYVIDLAAAERDVWKKVFWAALQPLLIDPVSLTVKASSRTYRQNLEDYRRAHVVRALAVLALFEAETGSQSVFTPRELSEMRARLVLAQNTFGGVLDDLYLQRVEERDASKWEDARGHNWELLRQRAEAEGLYFEPLAMPDGSATHALLWTTREDLSANRGRKFGDRFLNIKSPWDDRRLLRWDGYTEPRYFDAEGRVTAAGTPGARRAEMIPLALYGLAHPKIPILLVDFRDTLNPKGREMSRRVLKDVTRTAFSFSRFDLAYTLGRAAYDWVTYKRGVDVNQPSRLRAYSQLKLLLSLDASLDPRLREQINSRLEVVSLNPLENDRKAEARLAREQYAALVEYARRPDGLAARLDRDRREELVPVEHGRAARTFFKAASTLTFGLYTHREDRAGPAQIAALDTERRLAYHRRLLREVARTSSQIEVEWDAREVRRSLEFLAEHGARADGRTATAVAAVFARTRDESLRRLCLDSLYRINNETAKTSLVRIYRDESEEGRWRALSADYLRRAASERQRVSPDDARIIAAIGGN
jgi:hypothetical protein